MGANSEGPQSTQLLVSLLAECCITVCDAGPTLKQHWIDASRSFAGITTVLLIVKCRTLVQCYATVFHTGPELKHHWINVLPL